MFFYYTLILCIGVVLTTTYDHRHSNNRRKSCCCCIGRVAQVSAQHPNKGFFGRYIKKSIENSWAESGRPSNPRLHLFFDGS